MRIIPDKTMIVLVPIEGIGGLFWKHEDTIEITDAQLNTIYAHYGRCHADYVDFADCLRQSLSSLTGGGSNETM